MVITRIKSFCTNELTRFTSSVSRDSISPECFFAIYSAVIRVIWATASSFTCCSIFVATLPDAYCAAHDEAAPAVRTPAHSITTCFISVKDPDTRPSTTYLKSSEPATPQPAHTAPAARARRIKRLCPPAYLTICRYISFSSLFIPAIVTVLCSILLRPCADPIPPARCASIPRTSL